MGYPHILKTDYSDGTEGTSDSKIVRWCETVPTTAISYIPTGMMCKQLKASQAKDQCTQRLIRKTVVDRNERTKLHPRFLRCYRIEILLPTTAFKSREFANPELITRVKAE